MSLIQKFIAVLKDSVREAIDGKIFYVLMVLSGLVVLGLASVSYERLSVERQMVHLTDSLNWVFRAVSPPGAKPPRLAIEDFRQTNEAREPWEGNYQFTFVVRHASVEDAKRVRYTNPLTEGRVRELLSQALSYMKDLDIKTVESADESEQRFQVTNTGTDITDFRVWPHEPTILFAVPLPILQGPLAELVEIEEYYLVNWAGTAILLLVSVVVTGFFIPNMLRKGNIDLLLVKPISRVALLIFKYVGGLSFVFLSLGFLALGAWTVIGLRTGIWGIGFLGSVFILTFQFAILYAFSTCLGVLTRSPIVAILGTVLVWGTFAITGYVYNQLDFLRNQAKEPAVKPLGPMGGQRPPGQPVELSPTVYQVADVIHAVLPRVKDLDNLSNKLIRDDLYPPSSRQRKQTDESYQSFHWGETLVVSFLHIFLVLGLSCWWFATKDY